MRVVFADSGYWIALLNSSDQLHERALEVRDDVSGCTIVSSEMVLVEVMNYMSGGGRTLRQAASALLEELLDDPDVEMVMQTSRQFETASRMYAARPDQTWSLTDCASFLIMREYDITHALAHDRDFEQAGFVALLR